MINSDLGQESEVIPGPSTSITELENGIFTLVITLVNHYMHTLGYSKEESSVFVADLLDKYVVALRS